MKLSKKSRLLTTFLLLNSFALNTTFASILSEDGRLETFQDKEITIPNVLEEDNVDIKIEGNTMVNIFNGFSYLYRNENITSTYKNRKLEFKASPNYTGAIHPATIGVISTSKELVGGKTYTMYFKTNIANAKVGLKGRDKNYTFTGADYFGTTVVGKNKIVFTLEEDISRIEDYALRLYETNTRETHIFEDIVIMEGNCNYDYVPYFEDVKSIGEDAINNIKNDSLVNLFNGFERTYTNEIITTTFEDRKLKFGPSPNFSGDISYANIAKFSTTKKLNKNQTYTLYFKCNLNNVEVDVIGITPDNNAVGRDTSISTVNGENKIIFKVNEDMELADNYMFRVHKTNTRETHIFEDFVLLEGAYTYDYVPYFEGTKPIEEIEQYKLELQSKGKNLFDINKWKDILIYVPETSSFKTFDGVDYEDGTVTLTGITDDTYTRTGSTGGNSVLDEEKQFLIKIKPSTKYTISFKRNGEHVGSNYYQQYDANYNRVSLMSLGNQPTNDRFSTTFISNANAEYLGIRFGVQGIGNTIVYSEIQIEESDVATEYSQYTSKKIEIPLKEPLRSIPNSATDKIIKKNGQWVIERNCGEAILDGSEGWFEEITNNNIKIFSEHNGLKKKHYHKKSSKAVLSDKLINNKLYMAMPVSDYLDYSITTDLNGSHEWRITTTQEMTVNDVRDWLNRNRPKVVYELETSVYEPLNVDLSLPLYENTTYIETDSVIPPLLETIVDRTINRAVESIELAKINPTSENISQARYWSNLMRETIKKDELQDKLDDMTATDITIDKKKASANIDVYVRSKNSLTISLDTNNILFDGYNGVDSMEKQKALNITINSSLPYDLNAYLPEGIVNNDNSNSIPVNSLSLKDSTDINYQPFVNTSDKIVLKSNCEAGESNIHSIDFKLASSQTHKADVYKTTIKFEVEQK